MRLDRARQITVTLAGLFCIIGTLVGTGVIGTRVAESSGGALSADATLLAPAGTAFTIWSVVYAGLLAYTVWQWLPGRLTDPLARTTGWWAALSMVLNAAWLLVTQEGWIRTSVAVIVALAITLIVLVARASRVVRAGGVDRVSRVVVDGTFGLYLGWVAVATCANIAAAVVSEETNVPSYGEAVADTLAICAIVLVTGVAVALARFTAGWPLVLAAAWGLAWIAVGRWYDEPESISVAVSAAAAALIVLCGPRVHDIG